MPLPLLALVLALLGAGAACRAPAVRAGSSVRADVCVYGATSAGVVAALQAVRMGRTVALVDCDFHVGGLTTSGLGATDIGNKAAIGGLSRRFYQAVKAHYDAPAAWTRETRGAYLARGYGHAEGDDAAWSFEPSVASSIFDRWLAEAGVVPLRTRLDRSPGGIEKDGARIVAAHCEDGTRIEAAQWLDCSYEGDLLAAAGASYAVGREANAEHGETLNGSQTAQADKHQFQLPVQAWRVEGDPSSGLLPGVEPEAGPDGAGDSRIQAYCFRMCVTDDAANRLPWTKPAGYDERDYELLLRHFDAGATMAPWHPLWMPNRKTDANNNGAVSTDFIGANWEWPEATYARRDELRAAHLRWQQGLMWTLAHHPRVPQAVRDEIGRCGPAEDEFRATGGWPPLLYVREARRLRGMETMTEGHCLARSVCDDPVGLAAYTMDSHHVRRHVDAQGHVRNEGDVQVRVPRPYGVSYRALLPRPEECSNLLVPVCVSATHIAYGSIRMEPVYMVLAQSAATAACLALERGVAPHELSYAALRERLVADGQVLEWR